MPKLSLPLGEYLAQVFIAHTGQQYVWGGAPGRDFRGGWDCSSAVNSVVGGIGGQSIPGYPNGTYDGTVHGPNTTIWAEWIGSGVGTIPRSVVDAGDIMLWQTHMGLAIDNTFMMSAEDPAQGTQRGIIDGFMPGETLTCLRLPAIGKGGFTPPPVHLGSTSGIEASMRSVAQSARSLVWARQRVSNLGVNGWRV